MPSSGVPIDSISRLSAVDAAIIRVTSVSCSNQATRYDVKRHLSRRSGFGASRTDSCFQSSRRASARPEARSIAGRVLVNTTDVETGGKETFAFLLAHFLRQILPYGRGIQDDRSIDRRIVRELVHEFLRRLFAVCCVSFETKSGGRFSAF